MSKYECAKCGSGFDDGDIRGRVQAVRLEDGTVLCAKCNKVRTKVPAKVYADVHAATLMESTTLGGPDDEDVSAPERVYVESPTGTFSDVTPGD